MKRIIQTQERMKIKFNYALLLIALFVGFGANAQKFSVESMKMELDPTKPDGDRNYEDLVKWAEETKEHPKTSNDFKMWYYRGLTFLKVSTLNTPVTEKYPNALDLALEGFQNSMKTDVKKKLTKLAEGNLLNVAIGYYNRGYTAYQAEEYTDSYKAFETALPLMEYDVDGVLKRNNLTAEVLQQMMAYSAMNNGEDAKASTVLKELIDNGSSDPAIFSSLARLQLKGGDTTAALQTIADGKDLNESDKSLMNMELDIYLKQGKSAELIEKLDAAIAADPGSTIYYFARAISFEGLGETDKAAADYDKIIEIDPEYYDAYYNKGVMYLNKVSDIVASLDGVYKPSIIQAKEQEIAGWYNKAISEFETVFDSNDDMPLADKVELAGTMKKIYARLEKMDKYAEMKAFIVENE
jgi:tetratricopeptide (TPR) repeat protein